MPPPPEIKLYNLYKRCADVKWGFGKWMTSRMGWSKHGEVLLVRGLPLQFTQETNMTHVVPFSNCMRSMVDNVVLG